MEYPKFKVCCRCFTFNQAKYITDAMNGFTIQQTSFPFVCAIVDDASTDGEQEVIKQYVEENFDLSEGSVSYKKETEYAHIIYAQHKTNKNCYFAVLYLKENHYSQRKPKMGYLSEWRDKCEYEALCEGDDYWIDPDKLQKQADFLNANPDYGMCYSKAKKYIQESNTYSKRNSGYVLNTYKDLLISGNPVPTLTSLFRTDLQKKYNDIVKPGEKNWKMGDYPFWIFVAHESKIHMFDDFFGVYRVLSQSASSRSSYEGALAFKHSAFSVAGFMNDLFDANMKSEINKSFNTGFFLLAIRYSKWDDALMYYSRGIEKTWKNHIRYLFLKYNILHGLTEYLVKKEVI